MRLGPYEIVAPAGAGGMGEVYRARDTRLDRTVAIKVLPAAFASNTQLKQRFEREARLISQLSHQHICTIHDVGNDQGIDYLVMEYLEGETLADRLGKGPLPVDKAVRIAIEIADALDKAHRQGIVHRDLKPANVMLTRGGAKLLDFGLAKTATPIIDGDALTMQKSLTAEGTIVGTFQYMAPEQLEGLNADARTDIFAFGAVLYEMITGRRAFDGKTRTSVIAAIVDRDPPPLSQVQPLTPPALERLVRNCLAKNADDRWQTMHDILLSLRAIEEGDSAAGVPRPVVERRRRREMLAWTLAALFFASAAIAGALAWKSRHVPAAVTRASVLPPKGTRFQFTGDGAADLTISPDGRYITFIAKTDGVFRLWVRRLDRSDAQPLAGTEGAGYPFWSPDSKQIAFFARRKLKRVAPTGGAVVTITSEVIDSRGGAWGADDVIVYSHHWRAGLSKVSANGGKVTPVTKLDVSRHETTHRFPRFLPDGKHFIYLAGSHTAEATSGENAIYVSSVDGGASKLVVRARSNGVYAAGHLLYALEGKLVAQPFDPDDLAVSGDPVPIAESVRYDKGFFRAVFDASPTGTLVYQEGSSGSKTELVWFDRSGKRLGTLGQADEYFDVRIAPDGAQVAASVGDPADIWIFDVDRGVRARLTYEQYNEQSPIFSPDGNAVLFASDRTGLYDLLKRTLTGKSVETPVLNDRTPNEYPTDWTSGYIIYNREEIGSASQVDIWALPLDGRRPFPVLQSDALETDGRLSPDGRWLAYTMVESGAAQVYVTTFPEGAGKWQVSTNGGGTPLWRSDGRELFYIDTEQRRVMSAAVTTGERFEAATPVALFTVPLKVQPPPFYDVTPDGNRFLVNTLIDAEEPPITLVTNWTTELQK
ncbi:MAG: serine/threonine-protein kinase [Acidobacteriota bacterium]|nr:serine/threonine-protein kinase [Acidobacteriota bacterium]